MALKTSFIAFSLISISAPTFGQQTTDWAEVNIRLLSKAPADLRALGMPEFCAGYGNAIRMQMLPNGYDGIEAPKIVRDEAKRRKLRFNDKEVIEQIVRIGMTRCQMLAAWGAPRDENRSVGSWGEDIQHIYPSAYVYTRNGIVTSYQN